jgi:acetamidase/formamidase
VNGAGLSMGDLHFSQGDGEITFCGAIEMAGWTHLKVDADQGRHGEVRGQEPDLQAVADHAANMTTT